ncbi:MAG: tetratricopeptide repeat protein, partial [Victivallis vadensis]
VGVFALLGAFFLLQGAEADFNAAFDKGEFKQAVEDYRKQLNPQARSPALLYNIGSSYYRMNDLPRALYCFEQAHLLAPRDSETLENLNLVNRKLALPEIGRTNSPGALLLWCRDRLRPDQYWAIAAAVFALMCIGLGLRHSFRPSTVLTYEAGAALVLVLAITAAVSQANGPYNPDRGIVNGNSLELRTLPAAASGRIEATVPGGSAATVVERRGDWLRVKVNGRDGWAPAGRINIIFPGGVF